MSLITRGLGSSLLITLGLGGAAPIPPEPQPERMIPLITEPDGFERGLVGEVISRLERKGLRLVQVRSLTIDEELARRYTAFVDKARDAELDVLVDAFERVVADGAVQLV